jgi:ferredoxin
MKDKCEICNKNEANLLCDMPTTSIVRTKGRNAGLESITLTCDKKICHECAVEIHKGIHFCKECADDLRRKLNE